MFSRSPWRAAYGTWTSSPKCMRPYCLDGGAQTVWRPPRRRTLSAGRLGRAVCLHGLHCEILFEFHRFGILYTHLVPPKHTHAHIRNFFCMHGVVSRKFTRIESH